MKENNIPNTNGTILNIAKNTGNIDFETAKNPDTSELTDMHFHAGWTDFFHEDQDKRTEAEIKERIKRFLEIYKKNGIALARDAGGFDRTVEAYFGTSEETDRLTEIIPNCGMFRGNELENEYGGSVLEAAESCGHEWTKIFITGGVGTKHEDVLTPNANEASFKALVSRLHEHGKKIMVHCFGGVSLDWCIDAGVETVEHAVYMTKNQAGRMAEKGIAAVPTTSIYRLLAEEPELFGVPEYLLENAKRACEAHLSSVGYAKSEGVLIGYGTDFYSDPALAEYARYELKTLTDCGLSESEAVLTGTVNARKILGIK